MSEFCLCKSCPRPEKCCDQQCYGGEEACDPMTECFIMEDYENSLTIREFLTEQQIKYEIKKMFGQPVLEFWVKKPYVAECSGGRVEIFQPQLAGVKHNILVKMEGTRKETLLRELKRIIMEAELKNE